MSVSVLVGGVGNVFLGDDGFGVEVVERLRARGQPAGVQVADFGLRGVDLAFALPEYDAVILVDAVSRGGPPGTVYVLEPEPTDEAATFEPHGMTPDRALRWLGGARPGAFVRLVGCEPATFGEEGLGQLGLSEPVEASLEVAVARVEALIAEALDRERCSRA